MLYGRHSDRKEFSRVSEFLDQPGAGYLHSSGENFLRNYKEVVDDEKYYSYIDRFKGKTDEMVSLVLSSLSSLTKDNQQAIDFLNAVAETDLLKEGSKYLGQFATAWTSFDKQKTLDQVKSSSLKLMEVLSSAQESNQDVLNAGRMDQDSAERIKSGIEKIQQFYSGEQKIGYAPYYAGSIWEMLIALACASINQDAKNNNIVTITAGKNITIPVEATQDGKINLGNIKLDNQTWADLIVFKDNWKNSKVIKQPVPIQAKFVKDAELRSRLDNSSWNWSEDADWQKFLNLLYYVVNNYGTIKNVDGGDSGSSFFHKMKDLDKALFARGLIQVLATSKQKSSNLNDINNNFKYNIYDIIGDSSSGKIIAKPTFEILSDCLDGIGYNSTEEVANHFAYMHFKGADSFTFSAYLEQLSHHLGYDSGQLLRWKLSKAGAAQSWKGSGNFYWDVVTGNWDSGSDKKLLTIRDEVNGVLNKKVNRRTIDPTSIWNSINKKYRFFDGGKNSLDLRFRLNEIYK